MIHSTNNLYNVASLPLLDTPIVGFTDVITLVVLVISVVLVMSLIRVTLSTFEVVPNKAPYNNTW